MDEYNGILVIAELNGINIHNISYELLFKANELAKISKEPVDCLILGPDGVDCRQLNLKGAETVYYMKSAIFNYGEEYLYKENIVGFINKRRPKVILIGATNFGRSLAPRIAAALRTGLTADCTDLKINKDERLVQIRPAFSDNILAHITTSRYPQISTIRYKEFRQAESNINAKVNIVEVEPYCLNNDSSKVIRVYKNKSFDISEAEIIVAAGRGLKRKEDLKMIKELADKLGGVVGASRAIVDAGMISSSYQVGYSGNRVKPRIYIACGISGAPQHLAGMKESDIIFAINTDPSAPVFSVADYGYVGDIYQIVPRLIKDLKVEKI